MVLLNFAQFLGVFLIGTLLVHDVGSRRIPSVLDEKYRPEFHYSISEHWLNDPNGMFYLDGEYHLFYQYNPFGTTHGPMYWGQAVSTDLIHWTELGIALSPDELGDIWSGSGVVDLRNSSGFQTDPDVPPVVAIYTNAAGGHPQQQSIAFSNDKGRTFTKYEGNPVIPNPDIADFRDPKVIPYKDGWILVLAAGNKVMFYSSTNLKSWTYLSEFGADPLQGSHAGVWECPDLLEMTVGDETFWVLLVSIGQGELNGGSVTQYFIGNFDGTRFISSQVDPLWMDWGTDNYASVSFSNEPTQRNIVMGWMSNWDYANVIPTNGWRGQMTLPRELGLVYINNELRLQSKYPEELGNLANPEEKYELVAATVEPEGLYQEIFLPGTNPLLKLNLNFDISQFGESSSIAICFLNNLNQELCTGYDSGRERNIFVDRGRSGKTDFSDRFWARPTATRIQSNANINTISFEIYLDTSAIEVFVDDGTVALTNLFYPDEPLTKVEIRHHASGNMDSILGLESGTISGLYSAI